MGASSLSLLARRNSRVLEELHFARFNFVIQTREPVSLPPYKGSTFRGSFGNVFKKIVCPVRYRDCSTCLLRNRCLYVYIFETPPPEKTRFMKKYIAAPHPFVIEPTTETKTLYEPGERLSFGLVLIGRAIEYLPYFIYTFEEIGRIGIGKGRGRYILREVYDTNNPASPVYDAEDKRLETSGRYALTIKRFTTDSNVRQILITFLTPTRIVFDGHLVDDPEFHVIIRNLIRRIALLSYFHCGGDPSGFDFSGFISGAAGVKKETSTLRWHDWERYSSRQDTRMKLGGFTGEAIFRGDISGFIPYLKAGEYIHIGKGTSFGLGRYVLKIR